MFSFSMIRLIVCIAFFFASAAQGATYYVRNGGNDAADGKSHATAWATIDRVNAHAFAPGDRVSFHEGDRWEGRLVVDWAPATIGAYYLRNGVAAGGYRRGRPIIDGADRLPGSAYDALIVVIRRDRVRVENLEIRNSRGRAIAFADADYGMVVNCVTDRTYKGAINFLRSDHGVARRNRVSHAGLAYPEDGGTWAGAIEFVESNYGKAIENTVAEVYGEGFNANHGSTGTIIEKNYVFAARAVGIYADAAPNTTIRHNIVVGTSNSEYWRNGRSVGAGIALNNERYHYEGHGGSLPTSVQSKNAKIHGNLVSYTSSGLSFWGSLPGSSHDNVLVFNNTLVDNDVQINLLATPKPNGKLINNILLSLSPDARDVDRNKLSGMTAKSNYLSQGNPGGELSHSGNRYSGLSLGRSSGWRSITAFEDVAWNHFVVMAGSPTIGAGDNEPREMSQNGDTFDVDFNGMKFGAAMDLGALRFTEFAIRTPQTPEALILQP